MKKHKWIGEAEPIKFDPDMVYTIEPSMSVFEFWELEHKVREEARKKRLENELAQLGK